jgi:hypothetical protein
LEFPFCKIKLGFCRREMGRKKSVDNIITIDINVESQEKANEIVAFLKEVLIRFPEVDVDSIMSGESSWIIDGG